MKYLYIATMSANSLEAIEIRINEVHASYLRQVALAGKNGYDHLLTELLKKDLEWLREKKRELEETQTRAAGSAIQSLS